MGDGVKGRKRIQELLKKGAVYESECFKIYCLKNIQGEERITASISKKVGGAVLRNRLRRIVKEGLKKELSIPVDILVRVKKKTISFADVLEEAKKIKKYVANK